MSELKLNLIDYRSVLAGRIHGSVADSCVAALSAEPETIPELVAALGRYQKTDDDLDPFAWFNPRPEIDFKPYDAGLVIIDLATRVVAAESTYSNPQPEGEVLYHNGKHATDVSIPYRVPSDWLFVKSIEAYRWARDRRAREESQTRLRSDERLTVDPRAVLYGPPLVEFVVSSASGLKSQISDPALVSAASAAGQSSNIEISGSALAHSGSKISSPEVVTNGSHGIDLWNHQSDRALEHKITRLHATWLTTPRADLQFRSPREVLLERQDFIDFDLHTRSLQWSFLNEGPPCLARDSFAYRFAGFGTQEWVVYYDLVRHLLTSAIEFECADFETAVRKLEEVKTNWLESGNAEYDGRTPAVIIDNERKRLPEALSPAQLIIDEDCDCCRMMAQDAAMGFGPGFWHLDGSHMEEEFAFSSCKTLEEWEAELQQREKSYREFERQWAEREYLRRGRQREWDQEQLAALCGENGDEDVTLDLPTQ